MTLLEAALYFRQTPLGGPYVRHADRYFFHAALFNFVAISAVSLPFWVTSALRSYGKPPFRQSSVGFTQHSLHLGSLIAVVILDHLDNEVMRFLGTHLSLSLVMTYGQVAAWGSDILHALTADEGGAGIPFFLLAIGPTALLVVGCRERSALRNETCPKHRGRWPRWALLAAIAVPAAIANLAYFAKGGRFRKLRTRPAIVALAEEISSDLGSTKQPDNFADLVTAYQRNWLLESADSSWVFDDPKHPLVRRPVNDTMRPQAQGLHLAADGHPWNILYLQLETFRGRDMGFHRPELLPSPTPNLDELAADTKSAHWVRHLSFGPPTVGGFMAGHCSVRPHSRRQIITDYAFADLHCIPAVLRSHGYRAEFFTASDPDWDNEGVWLSRWYDQVHFLREADERDRIVFQEAAQRIVALGRQEKPFMATVVSISNHYPFRTREQALDINSGDSVQQRILNTTHYTDDVVGEFFTTLRAEPWFAHTMVIIVGDHGYNLGEHDGVTGQRNGHHEGIWVPLLIHGGHPKLPHGPQSDVASLLDVAPTIAALAGIREPNPWIGHSLLEGPRLQSSVTGFRPPTVFAQSRDYSLSYDESTDRSQLYKGTDLLQETDLLTPHNSTQRHRDSAAALLRRAIDESTMFDYLIETNTVWTVKERSAPYPQKTDVGP